ncbi:tetratricopeptide repeat protein [Treponema pectinovorum]|uniref:tetratricopeptide repeat protein n=1 Tax=Treponema pectinovorum TaxID=164 RepID=UPI0011CBFC99|nr:hypothetical protein [Treponema pectinovorum]
MQSTIKKSIFYIFVSIFLLVDFFAFAQSAEDANRRTAIRYLKLAEQYAAEKNWSAADSSAQLGLAYDEAISDLWYLRALSNTMTDFPKYKIIPLVQNALKTSFWVDYNKDSARILYADLLCATRDEKQAIEILDERPFIYSSDAEYIRIKCYYNQKDEQSLKKARERLDSARRMYPQDVRFAELFFRYEYSFGGRNAENSKLADSFTNSLSLYKNLLPQIEIYAIAFAQGEKKTRMLKSFDARSLKNPLYAILALEENSKLLSEDKALDYFYSFADTSVDYSLLEKFASLLKDEESKKEFGEYLNSYNGIIYKDTDGDLIYNLKIEYFRGRPQKIVYDENQDDREEWSAECDFGVPLVVHFTQGAVDIEYNPWPNVSRAIFSENENSQRKFAFNLVAETLDWTPFFINADSNIKQSLGMDFYIPLINENCVAVTAGELLAACSSFTLPSKERKNSTINVSVLDGKPQLARYYAGEKMYAQAYFENGIPIFRTVDMDGDGLFETTETYGFDPGGNDDYISKTDEVQMMINLFGGENCSSNFYIKMIQIDSNGDTVPDFTEEYTKGLGKISLWDFDNDGKWDVRYVKYPAKTTEPLVEESSFYQPFTNSLVVVRTENSKPKSVTIDNKEVDVKKSENSSIYWIQTEGSAEDEEKILKNVNQSLSQGVCIIVENSNRRILVVKMSEIIFAKIIPEDEIQLEKIER